MELKKKREVQKASKKFEEKIASESCRSYEGMTKNEEKIASE